MIIKKRKFSKPNPKLQLKGKKTKGSDQTIFFSIFLGTLILIVIGFLVFSNWQMNKRRSELVQRLENRKKETELLEEKKEELLAKISQTQKESYLEKEARERFNLKKPGEEVLTILAPEEEKKEEVKEEKSFWQRILEKLNF